MFLPRNYGARSAPSAMPQKLLEKPKQGTMVQPGSDIAITWFPKEIVDDLFKHIHNETAYAAWQAIVGNAGFATASFKHTSIKDEDLFPPEVLEEMTREWNLMKGDIIKYILTLGFVPFTIHKTISKHRRKSSDLLDLVVPTIQLLSHEMYQFGVVRIVSTGKQIMVCRPWDTSMVCADSVEQGVRTKFITIGMDDNILEHAKFYVVNMPGEDIVSDVAAIRRVVMLDQAADRAFVLAGASLADPVLHMVSRLDTSQFGGMTNEATVGLASIRSHNLARASADSVLASAATCKMVGRAREMGGGSGAGAGAGVGGGGGFKDSLPGGTTAPAVDFAAGEVLQRIAVLPAYLEMAKDAPVPQQNPRYNETRMGNACFITMAMGVPMAYLAPHMSHAQIEETAAKTMDTKCRQIAAHFKSLIELAWDKTNGEALRSAYVKRLGQTDVCFATEELLKKISNRKAFGYGKSTRVIHHSRGAARGRYRDEGPRNLIPVRNIHLHDSEMLQSALGLSKIPKHDAYMDMMRKQRGELRSSGMARSSYMRYTHDGIEMKRGMNKTARPVEFLEGEKASRKLFKPPKFKRVHVDTHDEESESESGSGSGSGSGSEGDSDSETKEETSTDTESDTDVKRKKVGHDDKDRKEKKEEEDEDEDKDEDEEEEEDGDSKPKELTIENVVKYLRLSSEDIKEMLSRLTDDAWDMITSLVAMESTRVSIEVTRTADLQAQLAMYNEGKLEWSTVRLAVSLLTGVKLSEVSEEDPIIKQRKADFELKKQEAKLQMELKEAEMQLEIAKMKAGLIPDCRKQQVPATSGKSAPTGSKFTPRTKSLKKRAMESPSDKPNPIDKDKSKSKSKDKDKDKDKTKDKAKAKDKDASKKRQRTQVESDV